MMIKKEKLQTAKKTALLTHLVSQAVLQNNESLFAKIEMKPAEPIGYYQHLGKQQERLRVDSEDVMVTSGWGYYRIDNTKSKELVYRPLILKV